MYLKHKSSDYPSEPLSIILMNIFIFFIKKGSLLGCCYSKADEFAFVLCFACCSRAGALPPTTETHNLVNWSRDMGM